jgi:hypothetical protein
MCDCFWPECAAPGCEETIPVHIGDYRFPREDVEAWCEKHIPDEPGVEVSVMVDGEDDEDRADYPKGTKFGLRLKRGELHPKCEDVNINLCNAEPVE